MDKALIGTETVDLLSRITGQKLSQRYLTPPVIFLAALVTVLLGVIYIDGMVTDEEKQRLQATLNRFLPTEGNVRQLVQLMVKGVGQQQVYRKISELMTLMAPFTPSQRLLVLGFGYQMSAADGDMDAREKKYLQVIANRLGIDPRYLAVLEASFSHQGSVDPTALNEVQSLLDPARFHELDTIFVKAASDMVGILPIKPETQTTQKKLSSSYEQLKEFKKSRQQLDNLCYQLYQIIKCCADDQFLPRTLPEEIGEVSRKLQSQRFRLAVVGEFSQGKSTLLNALLGEEIQPVRAIPCSGTVTVLKYGAQKRVICRYKDGREEEIPFDQYKIKAAISKEAALEHRTEELERFDIDEIIFEHPDLDFCKSGVEILDSPGLNEHPARTAITQKLLQDTDAAIFLTNAMRLLAEKKKELLQDVRTQLNGGKENEPAENLFIVVNFMDSLDDEQDRLDVRQRLESFVKDKNLLAGQNRIHYISAKAALKAILKGTEDEYLQEFQVFTKSIEGFLTGERGSLKINQSVTKIKNLMQSASIGLHQAEDTLDGKIKLSEAAKLEILEKIGEASGRDVRIKLLADEITDQVFELANESWHEWTEGLGERLANKVERWSSEHNPILNQQKVIQDYVEQFLRDLQKEIDNWGKKELTNKIMKPKYEFLEACIKEELTSLQKSLSLLDKEINTDFGNQINLAISDIEGSLGDFLSYLSGGLFAGGLGAGLLILLGLGGPIMWAVAGVGSAIAGALGFGMGGIHDQLKVKVFETGCEKFVQSTDKLTAKISEHIRSVFNNRVEAAVKIIEQAISLCENQLEQQEKTHKETVEQREAEKALIAHKRQEIEQVQKRIEAFS
jgi:uncharacterized tellurite resistance protein B-like protein/GTPase SAR1 family protein